MQLKLGLADMGQDTSGFSRVVPHLNLTPRQNRTDTIGFSRMVLQSEVRDQRLGGKDQRSEGKDQMPEVSDQTF